MTHTRTITAKPFKWMIAAILFADKSYRDCHHVLTQSRRELEGLGLNIHDNQLVQAPEIKAIAGDSIDYADYIHRSHEIRSNSAHKSLQVIWVWMKTKIFRNHSQCRKLVE